MRFSQAVLSLLLVSQHVAAAWVPASAAGRARLATTTRRFLLASQLHSTTLASVETAVVGTEQTESFRLAFQEQGKSLSPWHDIPLKNDNGTYNMVRQCDYVWEVWKKTRHGIAPCCVHFPFL
jgi:hypothetical protein